MWWFVIAERISSWTFTKSHGVLGLIGVLGEYFLVEELGVGELLHSPLWIVVQELRRIKPVAKMACHSVASWCHPRVPNLDLLVCVKDPHIW